MSELERKKELEVTITIGADGRIYFQDLPSQLLPVAEALCRSDPELALRLSAAERECRA
ncbi:MAG: hypothetical protein V1790_01945 [Planctomycetota bacterium]